MGYQSVDVVVKVLMICFFAEVYGHLPSKCGRPFATRDVVVIKLAALVVNWLMLGRLLLVGHGRLTGWPMLWVDLCCLVLLAWTLYLVFLAASRLTRLDARGESKINNDHTPG